MRILNRWVKVIDGVAHEFVELVVHMFTINDVDDVDIYVADPIWQWQQTEGGKFIMENAIEQPRYQTQLDVAQMGHTVVIIAKLLGKDATFYKLKYA